MKLGFCPGARFGRWSIVGPYDGPKSRWRLRACRCDCGTERAVRETSLLDGKSTSCGCLRRERVVAHHTTHGASGTRLHAVWMEMRKRCRPGYRGQGYENYAGRGVSVCPKWDVDFAPFQEWALANGYEAGLSIDRIDNDGNYEPSNCRWTTAVVQNRNRRVNIKSPSGELWVDIAVRNGISRGTFYRRTWSGIRPDDAATAPFRQVASCK